ncbi:MAG: tRNA lysidine(34) synthetase TilS [Chloroflexi bacterium]|nr:MAG: tRNA lysidine(34) synthetase TilS [Chloroflexota bacterium]
MSTSSRRTILADSAVRAQMVGSPAIEGTNPAQHVVVDPVAEGLRASGFITPGDRVLAAVSGGPDSTALLVALVEAGHHVVAAHYDHALQEGSARVAEHVRELSRRLGLELMVERRERALPRGSVQAGARALRYEFLERARKQSGAHVVAIAHTADDVVEGVVLHLLRGCGLAGMRGMPARRGVFVRPMLSVWRREIVEYLQVRGIEPLQDPANSNDAYARVRVRRDILPALERDRPGIVKRFYRAAARATALQLSLEGIAATSLNNGAATRSVVAAAPEPVGAELMRQLYASAGGDQPALSRAHVKAMLSLAEAGRGGRGVDLPRGLRLRIVGEAMQIVAREAVRRPVPELMVSDCSGCAGAGAAHLKPGLDLHLGYRTPGLRMRPLGGRGTRKLQDIFVDARVPREDRDAWPLVFAGDALAIVPGIAVSAEMAAGAGEPSLHVTVRGIPAKVESLNRPPGDPI